MRHQGSSLITALLVIISHMARWDDEKSRAKKCSINSVSSLIDTTETSHASAECSMALFSLLKHYSNSIISVFPMVTNVGCVSKKIMGLQIWSWVQVYNLDISLELTTLSKPSHQHFTEHLNHSLRLSVWCRYYACWYSGCIDNAICLT